VELTLLGDADWVALASLVDARIGTEVKACFDVHVHTCAAPTNPSSPPTIPMWTPPLAPLGYVSVASSKVKVE
jgi:hypothetical protein